jgi:hypothetical protein
MSRRELFIRGLIMPGLVTLNVTTVQAQLWPLVFLTSALISYVWAGSVKGIASSFSSHGDQVAYALGAGLGGVLGMTLGMLITWGGSR